MLQVRGPLIEPWRPDFTSSEQRSPAWTRLSFEGHELSNSLEAPEWAENPVQVVVCGDCGFSHCASGGYVHVSTTQRYVVWTLPQIDPADHYEEAQYTPADCVEESGCVLIPRDEWDRLAEPIESMPHSSGLQALSGRALADAWRHGATRSGRRDDFQEIDEILPFLEEQLLACDTLTPPDAIERVGHLVEWLATGVDEPTNGEFVSATRLGATPERLYLDGPGPGEWVAMALARDETLLAFSPEWVFRPDAT